MSNLRFKFKLKPEFRDIPVQMGSDNIPELMLTNPELIMNRRSGRPHPTDDTKAIISCKVKEELATFEWGMEYTVNELIDDDKTIQLFVDDDGKNMMSMSLESDCFENDPVFSMFEMVPEILM